jgi:hypothetical protein
MGRRSYSETARQRLLEAWTGQSEFGAPIGCVATTFTFDPAFFEEHCLARFLRIQSDPAEDVRGYLVEREERLSESFACVLVDQSHVPTLRSLRWHALPMRVGGGGIFHPKITLLLWEKRARVLIGSANLTTPGYRRNYEHMAVLDFGPEGDLPLAVLQDIVGFVRQIRDLAPGAEAKDGPQPALELFLRQVEQRAEKWPPGEWQRGEPRCTFVPIRPGGSDAFTQLGTLWSGPPANLAWVVSPFFSAGEEARRTVSNLERLLLQRGDRKIVFVGPGRELADRSVELEIPESLREGSASGVDHAFAFVPDMTETDRGSEPRALHAKSLWIQRDSRVLFLIGSSNFTTAGTGVGPVVNVEANLVYELPDATSAFARTCEAAYPPYTEVDLDAQKVEFCHDLADQSGDAEPYVPLPEAFGSALLRQGDEGMTLDLEIGGTPPAGFAVLTSADLELASEVTWNAVGRPPELHVPWRDLRPPTYLVVRWKDGPETVQAIWVVNVANTESLPPPEELRALPLDDLLDLLTSARPYHEVLALIWRRREEKAAAEGAVILDPHKRVDTRNFVIQRMKRIAAALEGMRERLERPLFTLEALTWRLRGPLGPLALAKRLAEEEGEGAAFMIAEVALAVHDAQLQASGDLGLVDVPREKRAVLDQLERLAAERGAPANLEEYVKRTFSELSS